MVAAPGPAVRGPLPPGLSGGAWGLAGWLGGESGSLSRGAEPKAPAAALVLPLHHAPGCRGAPGHSGSVPLLGLLLLLLLPKAT